MNSSETVISKKNFEHGIKWKMPSLQILTYVWNKFKSISRIKVKAIVSIFGSKKYRHIPDTALPDTARLTCCRSLSFELTATAANKENSLFVGRSKEVFVFVTKPLSLSCLDPNIRYAIFTIHSNNFDLE